MKALALLSGGLDSTLAVKLILDQNIEVIALKFTSPFCLCDQKDKCNAFDVAKNFKIPIKIIDKGKEYLKIVKKPKFGYGSGMNPCIDCRIFILKKAKKYAKKIDAKFIFTGEVLNERPMSQHIKALKIIEKETGLQRKLLRPLSAKLLPETEAEKKKWVDRNKLLDIQGRSRKPQILLAEKLKITNYPCPAGGCLLTNKEFTKKLKDLFDYKKKITFKDIEFLKNGRHFRFNKNKIIVGRNKNENEKLLKLKNKIDYIFEVPDHGSPITVLQGKKTKNAIIFAAKLTARYSDSEKKKILVNYRKEKLVKDITVIAASQQEINNFRV